MKVEFRVFLEYVVIVVLLCEIGSYFFVYLFSLGNYVFVDCLWMIFMIEIRVEIFLIENFWFCVNLFDILLSFMS